MQIVLTSHHFTHSHKIQYITVFVCLFARFCESYTEEGLQFKISHKSRTQLWGPKGQYVVSGVHTLLVCVCVPFTNLRNATYSCQVLCMHVLAMIPGNVFGRLSHARARREFPTQ